MSADFIWNMHIHLLHSVQLDFFAHTFLTVFVNILIFNYKNIVLLNFIFLLLHRIIIIIHCKFFFQLKITFKLYLWLQFSYILFMHCLLLNPHYWKFARVIYSNSDFMITCKPWFVINSYNYTIPNVVFSYNFYHIFI